MTAGIAPPRAARVFRAAPAGPAIDALRATGLDRVAWDADTGTPAQLMGAGIPVSGSLADGAIAEAAARAFIAQHLAVLAPGASITDFTVVSNVRRDDFRAVGFVQTWRGKRVLGAQIGFIFKADRIALVNSSALPNVNAVDANPSFRADTLAGVATRWIESVAGETAVAKPGAGVDVVLPFVRTRKAAGLDIEFRVVRPVPVELTGGTAGAWDVYVDAATALPIARRQTIRFATGTVRYNAPERWPGGTRTNYPAVFATHTVNGAPVTADGDGQVTWAGTAAATVRTGLVGTYVRIRNGAGLASQTFSLPGGGSITWNLADQERSDAQLSAYIHANLVKQYIRDNIAPTFGYLDAQLDVFVNESGNCNAYSTGDDIHFFPASSQCGNTARLADVVYHEYGHSVHANALIDGVGDFDGAVSEGMSDFLAATITNDPAMGIGFFHDDQPLRHIDPPQDKVYPDDLVNQVHADGEIVSGALWDARKALIASLGAAPGKRRAEKLWFHILEASYDIPSTFGVALVADDDDGNLNNGTPNECAIRTGFARHGLADVMTGSSAIGFPQESGLEISVPVTQPQGSACPPPTINTARLLWAVRGASDSGSLDMVETDLGGGMSKWAASLPVQPEGTVMRYRVELTLDDGTVLGYPNNDADPYYEKYIGAVVNVWCDDFEASAAQWTHGATTGDDEWQWGTPTGAGGDPDAAHGGTRVFGIDVDNDGGYSPDSSQWARSPEVDVSAYTEGVRLHYRRWLNVEDGFYDTASISVDGTAAWSNLDSMQGEESSTHHRDREWRFQDVDLTAAATDGKVQVEFRLDSDPGLEFGGWTLDDVCIVARVPGGTCGDGTVGGSEECDDGNVTDGDGCSASCIDEDGGGGDDEGGGEGGCCSAGTDPSGALLLGLLTIGAVGRRRRRRAR